MLPELRSERCLLRPWTHDDVGVIHTLWTAPEVRRYLWDDVSISRETAERTVTSIVDTAAREGIGCWTLHIPPESDEVAGFVGFRYIQGGPELELLYGLRGPHWGQGLATEASQIALDYLWNSTAIPRVYARTDPPNHASIRVMSRLGMKHAFSSEKMVVYLLDRPKKEEPSDEAGPAPSLPE